MTKLLELTHLVQQHRMAQVQVRCGRVEASLDAQRLAFAQLVHQLLFDQKFFCAALDLGEARVHVHGEIRGERFAAVRNRATNTDFCYPSPNFL